MIHADDGRCHQLEMECKYRMVANIKSLCLTIFSVHNLFKAFFNLFKELNIMAMLKPNMLSHHTSNCLLQVLLNYLMSCSCIRDFNFLALALSLTLQVCFYCIRILEIINVSPAFAHHNI